MICDSHSTYGVETIAALNRLLPAVAHSLACYTAQGGVWAPPGSDAWNAAIHRTAKDHAGYAQCLEETIHALGGQPIRGNFPTRFTIDNDLDVRYMARRVADELRCLLSLVEETLALVADVAAARQIVEEILGNTRGHIEALDALRRS